MWGRPWFVLCCAAAVQLIGVDRAVGGLLVVRAKVRPTTPVPFACVTAGRFGLRFDLEWMPTEAARAGDGVRLTFRDLFGGKTVAAERPLANVRDGAGRVEVTAAHVALAPSSYHVRIDLVRDGKVLSAAASGSCEVYVTREGESAAHVLGSFFIGRVVYAWDEKRQLYYRNVPKLPPTYDPFDPAQRSGYEMAAKADLQRHPELQHDGGVAFLHGARVYRRLGEVDRARFCEQVLKRTMDTLLDLMMTPDGQLHGMVWKDDQFKIIYHICQQDGFALKLISQAALYFRDVAGKADYAKRLLERAQPIVKYQFSQRNPLGCGGSGCKVYDGRILAGLGYYCLTERAMRGRFDEARLNTTFDFARRAAEHVAAERGWYDDGCYKEGKCHIGYGNQNILCGLLAARRIALAAGRNDLAKLLEMGVKAGFDFLARTNGEITGYIQWIPSRHSQWANGNMHEILDELREPLGDSEPLRWYAAKLWRPTYDFWVVAFHRCDILATVLLECDEYKRATAK